MSCSNATGGNTWTLVSGSPSGNQFEIIAVYQGENPASGLVLTTSNQSFYSALAASGTLKWDFEWITGGTGGLFSDGVGKSFSITLTGS
jgi:outer membrane protein assembly factor BamB